MKVIEIGLFLLCITALLGAESGGPDGPQSKEWKARVSEGQSLFHAGQWNRAETAFIQALQLARTVSDSENAVLTVLNELSLFYVDIRQFDKATPRLTEFLALRANTAGGNDSGLAASLNLLGASYRELGRYDDARAAHERALRILKSAAPERSSEIGYTLSALGSLEDKQCHFTKAQSYFARALEYLDRAPGSSSDLTRVGTLNGLASEYVLLGQFNKANSLFASALRIIDTPQYAQTSLRLQTLDRAAVSQFAQRKFTEAEKLWNRAISVTNPEYRCYRLPVLIHLAQLHGLLKEQEEAADLLRQAEQLYDQIYQTRGDLYALILADRGRVAMAAGDRVGAIALLNRALEVSRACENRDPVNYAEILGYRAMAAEGQRDLITAKTMLGEASRILRDVLAESPVTANCFFAYARVLKKLKLTSEAKEYERTAKAMLDGPAGNKATANTVDVKALRQGW